MSYLYKTRKKSRDKATGKLVSLFDAKGNPIYHKYFRAEIRMADNRRKTITIYTANRVDAKRQADLIQLKQDQIRAGERPPIEAETGKNEKDIYEAAAE